MFALWIAIALGSGFLFGPTRQHGYLSDPPSRASAWLVDQDFVDCCKNYDYNQMYCGGKLHQWEDNGGRCGICGDPWDGEREYEKGGSKYLGKIVKRYLKNSQMPVKVQITANHLGYIEFRLCNVDGWTTDANQECLNKTLLKIYPSNDAKYPVEDKLKTAEYKLQLPENLTCQHCVLQWKYVAGNSWGHDDEKNISCQGCGVVQEQFYGCADISILTEDEMRQQNFTSQAPNRTPPPPVDIPENSDWPASVNSTNSSTGASENKSTQSSSRPTTVSPPWKSTDTGSGSVVSTSQQCVSKLEFGTFINLSRVVDIYCSRVCLARCQKFFSLLQNTNFEFDLTSSLNPDARACIETCPLLCECN